MSKTYIPQVELEYKFTKELLQKEDCEGLNLKKVNISPLHIDTCESNWKFDSVEPPELERYCKRSALAVQHELRRDYDVLWSEEGV